MGVHYLQDEDELLTNLSPDRFPFREVDQSEVVRFIVNVRNIVGGDDPSQELNKIMQSETLSVYRIASYYNITRGFANFYDNELIDSEDRVILQIFFVDLETKGIV